MLLCCSYLYSHSLFGFFVSISKCMKFSPCPIPITSPNNDKACLISRLCTASLTWISNANPCTWAESLAPPTALLCAAHLTPDVITIGNLVYARTISATYITRASISAAWQPHLQAISCLLKYLTLPQSFTGIKYCFDISFFSLDEQPANAQSLLY